MNALEALERAAIVATLRECEGRQDKAAKVLGISTRVMSYKVKQHGIDWERWRRGEFREVDDAAYVASLPPELKDVLRKFIERVVRRRR